MQTDSSEAATNRSVLTPEECASRPILDLAARCWDAERYECFQHCYRSMRRLDDLVDHRKERPEPISASEQELLGGMLADWLTAVKQGSTEPEVSRLNDWRRKYALPLWPWERLVVAMQHDLRARSFPSWLIFRRYTEGAAIAPAAIFIYLAARDAASLSASRARDIALPLALFAYLVHIIRDLRKDLARGLFYLPDQWLARYGLTQLTVQMICAEPGEIDDDRVIAFVREYADVVRWYELRAAQVLRQSRDCFHPDGLRSLWIVHGLYDQMARRLYAVDTRFDPDQLQPGGEEIRNFLTAEAKTAGKNPR